MSESQIFNSPTAFDKRMQNEVMISQGVATMTYSSEDEFDASKLADKMSQTAMVKMFERKEAEENAVALSRAKGERVRELHAGKREIQSQINVLADPNGDRRLIAINAAKVEVLNKSLSSINKLIAELNKPEARRKVTRQEIDRRKAKAKLRGESLEKTISSLKKTQRLKDAPASITGKPTKARVEDNAKAQDKIADKYFQIDKAMLPVDEAVARGEADVDALAEMGRPDVSLAVNVRQSEMGTFLTQGNVRWPKVGLCVEGGVHDVDQGNAFVAWLFRDQLKLRVRHEIEAQYNGTNGISLQERKIQKAKLAAEYLQLQREQERMICILAERGEIIERPPMQHPLAWLEVEIEDAEDFG